MKPKIFIDGEHGTTGLQIRALLAERGDLEIISIPTERRKETAAQTQLPEDDRRRNVRGAFALHPDKSVKDKTVLLIDDVYTSGATVNECSQTLKRAGANEVYVLTLARAVY